MGALQLNFGPARVSSDGLPPAKRPSFWREALGPHVAFDMEPLDGKPFRCKATIRALPGLKVSLIGSSTGVAARRTQECIATDGNDDFVLLIPVTGSVTASQLGRKAGAAEGGGITLLNADPSLMRYMPAVQCLAVCMPPAVLMPLVPSIEAARAIPGGSDAMRLLTGYLRLVWEDGRIESAEMRRAVSHHIQDLVALVVGATGDARECIEARGMRAARLKAIKADILDRLDHPGLGVAAVAARNGVSPRYIQLLFEGEGTTFTQFVLRQRLARARRLLSDPRLTDRTISLLATQAGFDDISYFNRCFRKAFGATPSDIREMARRQNVK
ncbi:AraC family transcriptional regulator [Chelativorans xinjiangense]|uniref:AraC family transcriptional regulator n=1 Tax=Chelativorans xinjiangense TaxID=2681485 RepID=UPI0013590AFC|nr:AraC family transcriptional regulator [Chelativorans xinjiangense]